MVFHITLQYNSLQQSQMIHKKYLMFKNNGLLPKIQKKTVEKNLTTYALLNKCFKKEYQLHIHPSDHKKFVLFNATEYLHRQCSLVTVDSNPRETLKEISKLYPSSGSTLTMFIANDPQQAQKLLLGLQSEQSLLSLAYEDLRQKKGFHNEIFLSIIGVQNENSLTDELYFEWIKNSEELSKEKQPIKKIIESKSKIRLFKNDQAKIFQDQNISKHIIHTHDTFSQILKRFTEIKTYLQGWISEKEKREYYMMGEIYKLVLVDYDHQKEQILKTLKTHYIFRINQYIRTTSPLMLKLGMNLQRIADQNYKLLEIHDSKVFKLLSQCFVKKQHKNQPAFDIHMFLQVGQYQSFKEQFICLSPISQYLIDKDNQNYQQVTQLPYFYSKNFLSKPSIITIISQIQNKLSQLQKSQIREVLQKYSYENYPNKIFSQGKSDKYKQNVSFIKLFRNRSVTQKSEDANLDLEEFVHITSKIRILSKNRSRQGLNENSQIKNRPKRLKTYEKTYLQANTFELGNFTPLSKQQQKLPKNVNLPAIKSSFLAQYPVQVSSELKTDKFYQETKQWLGQVYGSKKTRKLKQFYKNVRQKKEKPMNGCKIVADKPVQHIKQQK